jgi:hypothetical protein
MYNSKYLKGVFMIRFTVVLGIIFFFLLIGCSKTVDKGSDKRIKVGENNGILFENILSGEKRTKYGWSEIKFALIDSAFAILSVPANEYDSVYFMAKITPEERSPYIWFTSHKNYSDFSISVNDSYEALNVSAPLSNDKDKQYKIGIRGTFKEYLQENIVLIAYNVEQEESLEKLKEMTDKEKLESGGNSVYIIPYPWRTIRVKIEGEGKINSEELINWANKNVFNQAICSLKVVDEIDTVYDCKVILTVFTQKDFLLLDETGNEYDIFYSNRISYAKIKYLFPLNDKNRKNFARAVACIMGVTEDIALPFNLMNENDNNTEHVHLTFRQWNQLHASESGR